MLNIFSSCIKIYVLIFKIAIKNNALNSWELILRLSVPLLGNRDSQLTLERGVTGDRKDSGRMHNASCQMTLWVNSHLAYSKAVRRLL